MTIKTTKKAECSIEVDYSSGASTASGLDPKTADAGGLINWAWKVGGHTTSGSWPISITCTLGDRTGTATTEFTVK